MLCQLHIGALGGPQKSMATHQNAYACKMNNIGNRYWPWTMTVIPYAFHILNSKIHLKPASIHVNPHVKTQRKDTLMHDNVPA